MARLMTFSPELLTLAQYLSGEFDNRKQAIADPAWYVHLRLWQRPVPLFTDDSLMLFAEQAAVVKLDQPYRPRILRLQQQVSGQIQVQYYGFADPGAIRGAGRQPERLQNLTLDQIELLPGCLLSVTLESTVTGMQFRAMPPGDARCFFTYDNEVREVSLGFAATATELWSYDKGIDPTTGQALWGAIMGPFQFAKILDFAAELPL